jgi:hypothetical protein
MLVESLAVEIQASVQHPRQIPCIFFRNSSSNLCRSASCLFHSGVPTFGVSPDGDALTGLGFGKGIREPSALAGLGCGKGIRAASAESPVAKISNAPPMNRASKPERSAMKFGFNIAAT